MRHRLLFVLLGSFLAQCSPDGRLRNERPAPGNVDAASATPLSRAGFGGEVAGGPGTAAHVDEATGTSTFTWADAVVPEVLAARGRMTPEAAARAYLGEYASRFRLTAAVAEQVEVQSIQDLGEGPIIVRFGRSVDVPVAGGTERVAIFRDEVSLLLRRDHALVAITGRLSAHLANQGGQGVSGRLAFSRSSQSALSFALLDLLGETLDEGAFHESVSSAGGYHTYEVASDAPIAFGSPVRARKVLFPLPERLEPAYYLELHGGFPGEQDFDHFSYVISATDGRILFRKNLVEEAVYTYRVYATPEGFPLDGPQGDETPHPTGAPDGYEPSGWAQSVLLTTEHGPISTNDPWLPPSSQSTVGNNVFAYADLAPPDGFGPGDFLPYVTSEGMFDRAFDPTKNPGSSPNQILAATTGLFYLNNFLHDWYYDSGFKEADGNGQLSNFGRGGLGNDNLKVEAQDASGRNNANMSTPADGAQPRMQMYVFDGPSKLTVQFEPASLAVVESAGGGFGPKAFNVSGELALADDGAAPNTDACTALTNGSAVSGKIAVVDRGSCAFVDKVQNAQNAGAIAVLVVSNASGVGAMGGTSQTINIPALLVDHASGNAVKTAMTAGAVHATVARTEPVDRDGTLDNLIVAHEWGHYISNRLVGNASGLVSNQARSMGEGWADFHAMLLTVKESDLERPGNEGYRGAYALAQYSSSGSKQGYYYGIRRAPYSIDFAINPLTFKHIQLGVALPDARGYSYGKDGSSNSEVHASGEVWASMLWEAYAALLNDTTRGLSFAQKQERMKRYLVAGYKLTPSAPTFLEARDAILAAALATDTTDFELMFAAFARRGAGIRAKAAPRDSVDHLGVVESFRSGGDVAITKLSLSEATTRCAADGIADDQETAILTVTVRNVGSSGLSQSMGIVTSSTPGVLLASGGLVSFASTKPFEAATATVVVTFDGLAPLSRLDFDVTVTDPLLVLPAVQERFSIMGNYDVQPNASASDDAESPLEAWTLSHDPKLAAVDWQRRAESVENHRWFGASAPEPADTFLISPPLEVAPTGELFVRYKQRFWFESSKAANGSVEFWDGGVLEVGEGASPDTWVDVGDRAFPGYNASIVTTGANPLVGRRAYGGKSTGYPALEDVVLNLGGGYAGKTIRLRFRVGSDDAMKQEGWELDDLSFEGITNTPFPTRVSQAVCP